MALILAVPTAVLLIVLRASQQRPAGLLNVFISILLGPALGFAGAWLHLRRGNGFGLLLLALASLVALDGAVATVFIGLPLFLLVLVSFLAAVLQPRTSGD